MSEHDSKTTVDHATIRRWAEERGGHPAAVKATREKDDPGILRIDFDSTESPDLERVSWDRFFHKFDQRKLAFLYQDKTADGGTSRFFKFVQRS
jgi:hypothetical protein